jgi:hypothetical protein
MLHLMMGLFVSEMVERVIQHMPEPLPKQHSTHMMMVKKHSTPLLMVKQHSTMLLVKQHSTLMLLVSKHKRMC